ncbi:hypothetical protein IMZ48_37695 [Candidatus Bathyarchaeota archaeon]|nr:hypothetical protein [Candidatus Bathyarchaeota archaeon]
MQSKPRVPIASPSSHRPLLTLQPLDTASTSPARPAPSCIPTTSMEADMSTDTNSGNGSPSSPSVPPGDFPTDPSGGTSTTAGQPSFRRFV